MIDWLKEIDSSILLTINGWNSPLWDEIMWFLTGKLTWFPFYLFLLILVYRKTSIKTFILFVVIGASTIGFADYTANKGVKQTVKRYRPSHHKELQKELHFYKIAENNEYRGGQYGFISGHATNSFAIALVFGLFLRRKYRYLFGILLFWAALVSYTRLYLGVHYPSDILGGMLYGSLIGCLGFKLFQKINLVYFSKSN